MGGRLSSILGYQVVLLSVHSILQVITTILLTYGAKISPHHPIIRVSSLAMPVRVAHPALSSSIRLAQMAHHSTSSPMVRPSLAQLTLSPTSPKDSSPRRVKPIIPKGLVAGLIPLPLVNKIIPHPPPPITLSDSQVTMAGILALSPSVSPPMMQDAWV